MTHPLQIFNGVDIVVKISQTVALVGPSVCGKLAIIALLERSYDVYGDQEQDDNCYIRDLQWLLPDKNPVLLDMSIKDSILYAFPESDHQEGKTAKVEQAAKHSNIHTVVMSLPDGSSTSVGDTDSQLSGGQKQRIAITRALIPNSKVLPLGEATSTLDSNSEKLVQEAMDRARYVHVIVMTLADFNAMTLCAIFVPLFDYRPTIWSSLLGSVHESTVICVLEERSMGIISNEKKGKPLLLNIMRVLSTL
ncbi:hypothetical protein BGZ95_000931 [Linnemannia exigua]|uniref:ABC transporter domain-containing protein n=1 Tax=Linnemannia exigua TaxID=604196 RepID=A0AAD4H5A6_9FUNG|nr:hypothetical protein BGZ95_000931 [Linnemannia exigua]